MRREFNKHVKVAAWKRCGGFCEGSCGGSKLYPGHFDYHHIVEDTFGGDPVLDNCQVLCDLCHDKITRKRAAVIAKSNRVRNKYAGIRKPSKFAYSKTSKYRKKVSGEVVLR